MERGRLPVPPVLVDLAAWTWRLLLLGFAAWLVLRVAERLYLVVLPLAAALLLTALLAPAVRALDRAMPRALAVAVVVVAALLAIAAVL